MHPAIRTLIATIDHAIQDHLPATIGKGSFDTPELVELRREILKLQYPDAGTIKSHSDALAAAQAIIAGTAPPETATSLRSWYTEIRPSEWLKVQGKSEILKALF